MKLLIASDSGLPRWDGVARFIYEIIPKLKEHFEITLLIPDFKGEKVIHGVRTVRIPTIPISIADYNPAQPDFKKIHKLVEEHDVVFAQTLGPIGAISISKAKKLGKKVIYYVHSIEWELVTKGVKIPKKITPRVYKQLKKFVISMYSKCNLLICPTQDIYNLIKNVGTRKQIIPVAVDMQKFKPPRSKSHFKKKLGLNNELIIGFTGRIAREKDLPTLFKAFKLVKKQIPCKLLIVGKGIKSYDKLIKEDKDIISPGSVNNVESYLKAMDIFVLPSLTETSSLATMEAMSTGLPCITTNTGIMRYEINNWENGIKFQFGNEKSLAGKIIRLLKNENLRVNMGVNARKTMRKYSWTKTTKKLIKALC